MKRIISLLLALLMALSLAACVRVPNWRKYDVEEQATDTETIQSTASKAWADIDLDFFREYLMTDISSLHQLVKDPAKYGIDYDSVERTLGYYSQDKDREWYDFERGLLARMDELDKSALSEREQLSYDSLRQFMEWDLEGEEFYGYYEPLTELTGIQTDIPIVFWFYELNTRQDVEDYLTLLQDMPRFFGELLEYERYRAEELHIFMPEASLNAILEDDFEPILKARETSFLIPLFDERVAKVPGLTDEEIRSYQEQNLSLVTNEYYQAYKDLKEGLEALRPYCRKAEAVKALGDEKYLRWFAYQLKIKCNDDKDPGAVADLLYESMEKTINIYASAYRHGGKSPKVTSVGSVDENLAYLKELLDPLLPPIPEVEVKYQDMPDELRNGRSTAFYLVAPFDEWQINHIVVADPDHHRNLISALAHEGFNGHLYQYVYHRSMPGLSLSQQLNEETAYAEAWSQYSERLFAFHCSGQFNSNDMLLEHANDIIFYALLFHLSVRANYFGDSFEDVYKTFNECFRIDRDTFRTAYYEPFIVGNPFYGIPYAYGYARIIDLHDAAQKTLGKRYDQKVFDAQYLSYGPAYFNLLEDRLDRWAMDQ